MSKAIKIGASIVGLLVLLFIVAIILLVTLVNPNNFKNQISTAVQKNTGRELTITGDIKWSFFPWLGLRLNQITLGNAPGFGPQPFAQLGEADVNIRLLPLFADKVEVGTVTLKDLAVHLAKNAKGQNNWSDLTSNKSNTEVNATPSANATIQPTNPGAAAAALLISNVDLSNASVTWQDQQTGQNATLADINLHSKNVKLGKSFPVKLSFHLTSNKPAIDTTIALSSNVYADPAQQTLQVNDGNLRIANVNAKINISGTKILTAPLFQGNINVPRFDLRTFLADIGAKVNTKDATAMQTASFQANTQFSPKFIKLSGLHATLDDTTVDGIFNFANATKTFNFDLKINQINLNRYSSAAPAAGASTTNANANANSAPDTGNVALLPVALLRQYSGTGSLQIGKLTVDNITTTNVVTQVAAKNGLIQVAPMTAELYQGKSQGSINLDVRSTVPSLSINESLSGIQVGPLFTGMAKHSKIQITGTGNLTVNLLTQGNTADALTRSLNGNIKFAVTNGAVKNIDISQQIYAVIAHVLKQNPPATTTSSNNQTSFSSLTGTVNIADGIANNNDLLLKSTAVQVNGSGSANLINQTINYSLKTKVVGNPFGKDAFNLQDKIGGSIPITVSGTFSDPKVTTDFRLIATALMKGQVQQQIDKRLPEIEKNLPENVSKTINSLRNMLGQ